MGLVPAAKLQGDEVKQCFIMLARYSLRYMQVRIQGVFVYVCLKRYRTYHPCAINAANAKLCIHTRVLAANPATGFPAGDADGPPAVL